MPTPIILPELGAGPMKLSHWYADVGDQVLAGERIVEILCEYATFEMTAPATGRLVAKNVFSGESVAIAQVLGFVEEAI